MAEISIETDTLNQTSECRWDFCCLSSETRNLCNVEYRDGGLLFVRVKPGRFCPYMVAFGKGFICHCPTRKEIYGRYRI